MTALASGENDVALPAVAGADEIGDMARAFRSSRITGGAGAAGGGGAAHRGVAEGERERVAAERARAAEEQAEVVRRLGAGLKNLAGGDLMSRLGDGFPQPTRKSGTTSTRRSTGLKKTMLFGRRERQRDPIGRAGDLDRLRRPVAPHRAAGGESRRDRRGARARSPRR